MTAEVPSPSEPETDPPRFRRWHLLVRRHSAAWVRTGGVASMLLGALVLAGWALGIPRVTSVFDGAPPMTVGAALAFVLCGLSLLLQPGVAAARGRRGSQGLAQALGLAVAALGLVVGAEYVAGWNFGFRDFAVRHGAEVLAPRRMTPSSAAAFACIGAALALLPVARLRVLVLGCAGAAGLIGMTTLAGYVWGASELRTDEWGPPAALHTAAGFALLGATISLAAHLRAPGRRSLRFLFDPIGLRIVASFAGALLFLILVGGLSYGAAVESARVARQAAQAEGFHGQLVALHADAAETAIAGRTFLLTGVQGDAQRWMERIAQLEDTRKAIGDVRDLAPAERIAVGILDDALAQLTAIYLRALSLHAQAGLEAARAFLAHGRDHAALAEVRTALLRVDELARAEEARQQALLEQHRQKTLLITLLFLAVAAFMLAAVFTAIRREMTARTQAERSLRRRSAEAVAAHRFVDSVIQNIPLAIFIKDAKHLRFVRINRASERLLGHSHEEMAGRTDHDFFPAREADAFVAMDRQALAKRASVEIPQEEIHTPHDGVRLLHTRKVPLLDEQGRPTHLLGIAEDVTDVRHKERQIRELNAQLRARAEELERVSQARAAFLATMSHEIRTPMNGMLGMLELLSLSPLDRKQREMLSVVAESGQSLGRIIDDVLDVSKIEAGKLELREEVASVAAIVQDVRNIHSAVASSKGLVVSAQLDLALSPAVWVDALRLRQILNNFVSNAVKFTERGHIEIRAEVLESDGQRQLLRLSVTDTGSGIAPQDQQRLFQPFVQVGAPAAGTAAGTGLGLVISRQLAALMGGAVQLRSALGQGTTLSLLVPVRPAPPERLPQPIEQRVAQLRQATGRIRPPPGLAEAAAEGTLVLVVDDHPVNRMLLVQQLRTLGYAAQPAADAAEALRLWQGGRFGLVLTDCQMPGMNGYELARRIRAGEAAAGRPRTRVVACTAMALPGELEKCAEAGMDDVVFKPVELRPLLEKMRRWLPLPEGAGAAARQAGAAPSPQEAAAVLDLALLRATWGAQARDIDAILAAFARSVQEDHGELRDAMARRDAQALVAVAHRMLGASKMVGAHALAESCELLNAAGRERDWEVIAAAMQAVDAEYVRVMAAVEPGH